MKSALLGSVVLLLAACGSTDTAKHGAANEAAPQQQPVDPPPPPSDAPAADTRRAAIINAVVNTVGEVNAETRVSVGYADIGGDEREEAVVYLIGPSGCTTGDCSLTILTPSKGGWRSVGHALASTIQIDRLRTRRNGWNDLAVGIGDGGGGGPGGIALWRFANGRYPDNLTRQPMLNRRPEGARSIILDEPQLLSL